MSDARLSMNQEKRAKFDAMAREMVQGSIIEDAVTRFVSQVIAECAASQAAEIERLTKERDEAQFLLRGMETARVSDNEYLLARATAAEAEREALRGLLDETTPFVAVAAAHIARSQGRPERHLLAPHYDLMQKLGLRVDDFTRAALGEQEPPNAQ